MKATIPLRDYRAFRKIGYSAKHAATMARDYAEFESLGGIVEWEYDECATLRDEGHDDWCTHRIDDDAHWENCDRCGRYRRDLSCNHEIDGCIARIGDLESSCWGFIDPDGDYKHDYRRADAADMVSDVLYQYHKRAESHAEHERVSLALIPAYSA